MSQQPGAPVTGAQSLVRSLEQSLRRLRTDYVDLLWVHMRDATTPIEEIVRALDDQVRLGKVLYVGMSDSPAWVTARAHAIAELRGWSPFVGVQLPYSAAIRDPEREIFPMADELGLTIAAWGALEHGLLTGRDPKTLRWGPETPSEAKLAVIAALADVASELDATTGQVAIAWLLARNRPVVIPVLGARTAAQLRANLAAVDVRLSEEHFERIAAAGAPTLGFPRSFLESDDVRELIYGQTWHLLDLA